MRIKHFIFVVFCLNLLSINLLAQHKNHTISSTNSPNEPAIAIHPDNPNILVAAANINNVYRSEDAGKSWEKVDLSSSFGIWGDPVLACDSKGNFYFLHLSNPSNGNWIDRIVCQKSTDNGKTWNNGSYMGLNGKRAQDKQWIAVNPQNDHLYVTWTQFDKYGSSKESDKSKIRFSKSLDGGATWSEAVAINQVDGDCIDDDNTVEGAVPAVGPNGEIYVAWAGPEGIVFDKSTDEGETWLKKDVFINRMPGGWTFNIPGLYRANGLPITACDLSNGPNRGTIYVNWCDQRNGEEDTDVWLAKSTDGGKTWSKEIRVNNDLAGKHQFFTWMSVDQSTGDLYFVFYDRRNYNDTRTEVYMARSRDGGKTFENFRISEKPFIPNKSIFFGDYNNVSVLNGHIHAIWTHIEGTTLSIKTAKIDTSAIVDSTSDKPIQEEVKTINEKEHLYIAFKLHKKACLRLQIYDKDEKLIKTVYKKKKFAFGKHIEQISLESLQLSPDKYTYKLSQGRKVIKSRTFEIF